MSNATPLEGKFADVETHKKDGKLKTSCFGTVSQPLTRQPDLKENLQLPILVES